MSERRWHEVCIEYAMELLVALIVLVVGVTLELTRPPAEVVRVRSRRD